MIELDETHAAFRESAGHEAVAGEGAGLFSLLPVELIGGIGFIFQIEQIRHGSLHAKGHFVLGDARFDFRIAFLLQRQAVHLPKAIEHGAATVARHAGGVIEVEYGIAGGAQLHALVFAGQESGAPQSRKQALIRIAVAGQGIHDDERGKIFIHAAQAVVEPCAHAGTSGKLAAGLHEGDGGIVIDRLGEHRSDHAEFIANSFGVGEKFAEPVAAFARLGKGVAGGLHRQSRLPGDHAGDALALTHGVRQVLVKLRSEVRFVIE